MGKRIPRKSYIITSGNDAEHRVLAHMSGPVSPDIDELYSEFHNKYMSNYPKLDTSVAELINNGEHKLYWDYLRKIKEANHAAITQINQDGYEGKSISETFVKWLIKNYKYKYLPLDVLWLDDEVL